MSIKVKNLYLNTFGLVMHYITIDDLIARQQMLVSVLPTMTCRSIMKTISMDIELIEHKIEELKNREKTDV